MEWSGGVSILLVWWDGRAFKRECFCFFPHRSCETGWKCHGRHDNVGPNAFKPIGAYGGSAIRSLKIPLKERIDVGGWKFNLCPLKWNGVGVDWWLFAFWYDGSLQKTVLLFRDDIVAFAGWRFCFCRIEVCYCLMKALYFSDDSLAFRKKWCTFLQVQAMVLCRDISFSKFHLRIERGWNVCMTFGFRGNPKRFYICKLRVK